MPGKWGIWSLCLVLLAVWGCRTPQPNLKPTPQPEVLAMPPAEERFNMPMYPRQAFKDRDDPTKRFSPVDASGIMPARGSMAGGSPGMPGTGSTFNPYR